MKYLFIFFFFFFFLALQNIIELVGMPLLAEAKNNLRQKVAEVDEDALTVTPAEFDEAENKVLQIVDRLKNRLSKEVDEVAKVIAGVIVTPAKEIIPKVEKLLLEQDAENKKFLSQEVDKLAEDKNIAPQITVETKNSLFIYAVGFKRSLLTHAVKVAEVAEVNKVADVGPDKLMQYIKGEFDTSKKYLTEQAAKNKNYIKQEFAKAKNRFSKDVDEVAAVVR